MANYNVDIAIALKNSNKLVQLRKELKAATDNIREFNKEAGKQNKVAVSTFSKLNKQLSRANSLLDKAAIGTSSFTRAAKALVNVEKERNLQLKQREKLLDDLRGVTEKKAAADNKRLQDSLLKLERQSTKEQEQQFLLRQQGQDQLKQKVREINKQRKEENKLIKQNVQQTKKSVAEEIRKKFSIIAAGTERRKNLRQSVRELEENRKQIPINDRINAQLKKRGLILSSNGKQIIRNNQNRNMRGMGGSLPNAIGSGIIGGGFPLLFGQGATAALGGGIGGLAGGLIGGQFGFALSIAGTTIGNALDQLSKALVKPTENIEMLVNRLGLAGTETGDLALRLEKLGLESDAAELLLKEFEREFGLTADEFKENAETLKTFNNEINKLGTSLTLMMANVLSPLIKELNNLIEGKRPEGISRGVTGTIDFFTSNLFDLDKRGGILDPVFKKSKMGNIPSAEGNAVIGGVSLNPAFGTNPDFSGTIGAKADLAKKTFQQKEIIPLKQALEIEQKRLTTSADKLNLMQQEFQLINLNNELELLMSQRTDEVNKELDKKIEKLQIARDTQAQVVENTKKLIDPFKQLSDIIQVDIGNGIKGLIQGTETLNNVLRNVLNKLADAALNMAIFGNIGGGSVTGGLLGAIFPGKANGGSVKGGSSYIVGERGAELFTPGVSGMITPNHELGGSTNIVVNVDASGSSVEGDEEEGRELGRLISVAIQSELIKQKRPGGMLA